MSSRSPTRVSAVMAVRDLRQTKVTLVLCYLYNWYPLLTSFLFHHLFVFTHKNSSCCRCDKGLKTDRGYIGFMVFVYFQFLLTDEGYIGFMLFVYFQFLLTDKGYIGLMLFVYFQFLLTDKGYIGCMLFVYFQFLLTDKGYIGFLLFV